MLLSTACASPIKRYYVETKITTYHCPEGSVYLTDGLCHYQSRNADGFIYDANYRVKPTKKITKKRKSKIDCKKVYEQMNMCMSIGT